MPDKPTYFVGLDLGQASDYTAIAIIEKHAKPVVKNGRRDEEITALHCRHLERFQLGTLYPDVVAKVIDMLRTPVLKDAALVIDGTGVGRGVCDMFTAAGVKHKRVLVTGGDATSYEGGYWRVPKRDLVAAAQVPLHQKILKFADVPLRETLVQEMINFKIKITESAHDTYGAWRDGEHDDIIFAVMLACWAAKKAKPQRLAGYWNVWTGEWYTTDPNDPFYGAKVIRLPFI